jgi:hypothetical protein
MREPPRIGAEIAGYRLESLVARGGMAVVYLAEDIRLGRKVALKILAVELSEDDSFRERFLRESRIAASIDHPNVIPIYDAGEAEGLLYIAMRRVEDSDLRGLLRAEAPLEIDRSISIGSQVAGALAAAHRHGLVHRDVKPANVLLIHRPSPRAVDHVYLSDFGLAKHASSVSGLTQTGQFVGTVSYTAPEQAAGKPVDARTDIYALGCVLFECLTGRPPFRKDEDVAVVMAHLNEPAPAVTELRPECPPALAATIARTLAKSPDDRFQTCEQLIDALQVAGASRGETGLTATSAPAEPEVPEPTRDSRRPAPMTLIAGALAAAVIALVLALVLGGGNDAQSTQAASPAAAPPEGPGPETEIGTPPKTGEWREIRSAPTARQQTASDAAAGRIYVIGGLTGTREAAAATKKVEVYDPAIDTWTAAPDLPLALHHAMAVSYRGELTVIGGWVPEGAELTAETSSRVFALRNGEWVELPSLSHARAAGAAAVVDDRIVVVGGQADGQLVPQTEIFDGEAWHDAANIPTPREHLAAASDGHRLYAVGGRELSADKNSDALERFDLTSGAWTRLPSMPTPAGSLGAAIIAGNLVAVGGETPTAVLDDVQAFNLKTQKWSELPPLATPRHGLAVAATGGTLYAIDGALAPTHAESTNVAEALDFAGS